ncbi:alcohol dehydrogenase catalytic domain-containing protein [Streptomyces cocklensis]|uniref:Alcohol dehydrogenase n=1 Tax=Actinacidiphila cocklensis TaxID=887465 RepID=A0A9W4GPV7_9ACTN|nr:alcohol dehydrogenase catalytic domain-containing protein [Actinacidiphila cocklensis]MDD1062367.1 alcohol dehydrogenase catalytic domain-containing protein [Actinacidiphila cocklensis]CAG6392652.1 Alcohol dehydrogenase [Actinacidiphila cocklensis]
MSDYRALQVTGSHNFAAVRRRRQEPGAGEVRLRVEACGVCHTDVLAAEGVRADPAHPIVPGHEIVGVVDAVGAGVTAWREGDRVGVGFLGGHCGECRNCRRGDFVNCENQPQTGTTVDGGYAESVVTRATGLVRIPDGLSSVDAAPLLCAGLTSYKGLAAVDAEPGALVAIQGIGGLGHLALQYAHRLGYRVAAIARGGEKAELARALGADHYIDSLATDPGEELRGLGGAAAVIATAASGASMTPLISGLRARGQLIVLGAAPDPLSVQTADLIFGTRRISGSLTGTPIENEDNLQFCLAQGIRPSVEVMPLSAAPEAYAHMLSGRARFRVVLDAAA